MRFASFKKSQNGVRPKPDQVNRTAPRHGVAIFYTAANNQAMKIPSGTRSDFNSLEARIRIFLRKGRNDLIRLKNDGFSRPRVDAANARARAHNHAFDPG
jgi:hypothetical protein